MKIALLCHSLLSDWNHGNAHFLRGLVTELQALGHEVRGFEPVEGWSVKNLTSEFGELPLAEVRRHYPTLDVVRYWPEKLDLDRLCAEFQLVIVHEWNESDLVEELGRRRRAPQSRFRLLYHDTHHRAVTDPKSLPNLDGYDGVLAFGETLKERYVAQGWAKRVWVFHEAADTGRFVPIPEVERDEDLVWVGNFGDDERTAELDEFLFGPVRELGLRGTVYGVRYPQAGIDRLKDAGLAYGGWLANYRVPRVFARHRVTVHVPRRPYARALPGIPTIRVFEALACGIPLVSAPWQDSEGLFRKDDFWRVENGEEMRSALRTLVNDPERARELAARGRETVLSRHSCAIRARELLSVAAELGVPSGPARTALPEGESLA